MTQAKARHSIDRRTFLLGAGALAAGSYFPRAARAASEIVIANLHPVTGFVAVDGKVATAGCMTAVDEINEAGGIRSLGGAKLRLISADTQGKNDIASVETQRVIQGGAVAIVGSYLSSTTRITTQVAEQHRVPHVADEGVADEILQRGFKYTFRIAPSSTALGALSAANMALLMKSAGLSGLSVAYMHEDSAFGASMGRSFPEAAKKNGIDVRTVLSYAATSTDLSVEVSKLIATGADVIAASTYYGDGLLIAKIIQQRKPKIKAFVGVGSAAYANPTFVKDLGAASEGYFNNIMHWNPNAPALRAVLTRFAKFGEGLAFTHQGAYAYTAVKVLADAIERAKSTERDAIREALAKTNFSNHILPQGPIVFDETGQNRNAGIALLQVQKGRAAVVLPEQYAEAKPMFPVTFA
jgi:branched-chain amino acid transport system substrate-binding protein